MMGTARIYLAWSTWDCIVMSSQAEPDVIDVYPDLVSADIDASDLTIEDERDEAIEQVRAAMREKVSAA